MTRLISDFLKPAVPILIAAAFIGCSAMRWSGHPRTLKERPYPVSEDQSSTHLGHSGPPGLPMHDGGTNESYRIRESSGSRRAK